MNGLFASFGFAWGGWSFATLFCVALLQLLILILLFVLFWRRGTDKGPFSQTDDKESPSDNGGRVASEPSWSEIRKDLVSLRQHLGTRYRQTPVFLALGGTLPESVLSVFAPYGGTLLRGTQLDMYLYDRGVLISPRGNLSEHAAVDPSGYDALFRELLRMRSRRALDGVLLSLSVQTMQSSRQTEQTATRLHEQLARLQRITGMNYPIHLLFCDSEKLTGFQAFGNGLARSRSPKVGKQITVDPKETLSWSSPYDPEIPWDYRWLREAQQTFSHNLRRATIRLFSGESGTDSESSRQLFLLADELEKLAPNLELFCNVIFSRSVYHERFLFRELGFCGTICSETTPRFLFADGMLRKRLLVDSMLAVPLRRLFQARRRSVRTIQTIIAIMLAFWLFGMFWAFPSLKQDVQMMVRFGRVLETLKFHNDGLLKRGEGGESAGMIRFPLRRELLENVFLETQSSAYDNLRSPFFPTSYFSAIPGSVSRWQEEVYQLLINDTIPLELERKARLIYEVGPDNQVTPQAASEAFLPPLETSEFAALQNHIDESAEFCVMFSKYDTLLKNGDVSSFLELIHYFYRTSFTIERLIESRSELDNLLHRITHQRRESVITKTSEEIRFEQLKARVVGLMEQRFVDLTNRFDEKIYTNNPFLLRLKWVCNQLNGPPSFVATLLVGERLNVFYRELQHIMLALRNPDLNWILNEAPLYSDKNLPIRDKIRQETFLDNRSIDDWDRRSAELKSQQFQALLTLKYNEKGEWFTFLDEKTLTPQPWLEKLDVLLQRLQREDFMEPVEKTYLPEFSGNILSLEWNNQMLHDAVSFAEKFETIFSEAMPERFSLIQARAGRQLIDNMHRLVTDAVQIRRPRSGGEVVYGNFPEVKDSILQILAIYNSFGNIAKRQREELENLAGEQALAMLADFDRQCERDGLYRPRVELLAKWDGKSSVLVPLLGIPSEGAIEPYLQMNRRRLIYWQSQIAPLLVFLDQRKDFHSTPEDIVRIEHWKGISEGLDLYDKNDPNNPLTALELFVKLELTDPERTSLAPSPNWFYQRMYELDQATRKSGEKHEELHFYAQWEKAAEFFNTHLQGRFPFVAGDYATAPSASPDAIRNFYQLLPEVPNSANQQGTWIIPLDYLRFYEQMIVIQPLFFGNTQGPNMIPDLMVSVDFRVPDPTERGGQRLLDQSIRLGSTELSLRNGVKKGVWQFGTPTRFTLHWAKDGGVLPQIAPNQNAKIVGNRLVFEYDMPWSLLVFLYENAQVVLEQDATQTDRAADRVGFDIPTAPGGSSPIAGYDTDRLRTFLRIRLYGASEENESMEILLPRQFPDWMPAAGGRTRLEQGENQPFSRPSFGNGIIEWEINPPMPVTTLPSPSSAPSLLYDFELPKPTQAVPRSNEPPVPSFPVPILAPPVPTPQ